MTHIFLQSCVPPEETRLCWTVHQDASL